MKSRGVAKKRPTVIGGFIAHQCHVPLFLYISLLGLIEFLGQFCEDLENDHYFYSEDFGGCRLTERFQSLEVQCLIVFAVQHFIICLHRVAMM